MNTKTVIIAILVIIIVLLLWRNWSLMYTNGNTLTRTCPVGAFLVNTNVNVSQFKFDVNTPTTRNLRALKIGDCITGFTKRFNSGQEERIVTTDGFDITGTGNIVA